MARVIVISIHYMSNHRKIHIIINPESENLLRPCRLQPLVDMALRELWVHGAAPEHLAFPNILHGDVWKVYFPNQFPESPEKVHQGAPQMEVGVVPWTRLMIVQGDRKVTAVTERHRPLHVFELKCKAPMCRYAWR
jgi:hypothetical protein